MLLHDDVLTPIGARVLGSLAEKAATVPDTYPMTLKGLTTACNQRNSRDPITDHTESDVVTTLDTLKATGLVRFVFPSHGARSTKYRHVLDEHLGLDPAELALVAVLLLRGPQTVSELRSRTERAHTFASLDAVDEALTALADRDAPVVVHLPRQSGQKETRWMHLLSGPVDLDAPAPAPAPAPGLEARVADLESRLDAMTDFLADLGFVPPLLETPIASDGSTSTEPGTQHDQVE